MNIIFSPSKSQKAIELDQRIQKSTPEFIKQSKELLTILKTKTKTELQGILKASASITNQSYADIHRKTKVLHPALLSFSGTSFSQLDIKGFSSEDMSFAQEYLRILSARYGVLRPFDHIENYRLDMNNKLFSDTDNHKSLYDFWSQHATQYFRDEDIILNLASDEYAKMLKDIDHDKIIHVHFLVRKDGKLKNVAVYTKQERGKLLNHIIKNHITDFSQLKRYSSESFVYDSKLSDENNFYFVGEDK